MIDFTKLDEELNKFSINDLQKERVDLFDRLQKVKAVIQFKLEQLERVKQ